MGKDKSFLPFRESTVIGELVTLMKQIFSRVLIITNSPELYEEFGLELHTDIFPGLGPIGGIHSGLTHSPTERNFIISCDIPLITADAIRYVIDYPTEKLISVPRADGFIQQLCGVYRKDCLGMVQGLIDEQKEEESRDKLQAKRKCKVHSLVHLAAAEIIDIESWSGYRRDMFLNMNRPEEYEQIRQYELHRTE
jgi:molybdopterin-guanine dinucleotide biosynthesis protein A